MTREYVVQFTDTPSESEEAVETAPEVTQEVQVEEPVAEVKEEAKEEPKPEEVAEEEKPHKSGSRRAREARDRAIQEAAELRRQLEEERAKHAPAQAPVGEPQLADYGTFEEWQSASRAFYTQKAKEEARAEFQAEQARIEAEKKQEQWKEADKKFAEAKPDYEDALEELRDAVLEVAPKNPQTFQAVDAAISESDIAPQLKYHLGKNPDELKRLVSMTPIQAIKAVAALEKAVSEAKPPEKRTTQAPPPIDPLKGVSTGNMVKRRSDTYVIQ